MLLEKMIKEVRVKINVHQQSKALHSSYRSILKCNYWLNCRNRTRKTPGIAFEHTKHPT